MNLQIFSLECKFRRSEKREERIHKAVLYYQYIFGNRVELLRFEGDSKRIMYEYVQTFCCI